MELRECVRGDGPRSRKMMVVVVVVVVLVC